MALFSSDRTCWSSKASAPYWHYWSDPSSSLVPFTEAWLPFVDVVTTMLDESIPLTTNEFDEWGNPKQKDAYDYMMPRSPAHASRQLANSLLANQESGAGAAGAPRTKVWFEPSTDHN